MFAPVFPALFACQTQTIARSGESTYATTMTFFALQIPIHAMYINMNLIKRNVQKEINKKNLMRWVLYDLFGCRSFVKQVGLLYEKENVFIEYTDLTDTSGFLN